MTDTPFFIVGCGRSGTTLLRTLLNRHKKIAIPLESLFIIDYLRVQGRFDLEYLMSLVVREPELEEWGISVSVEDLADCVSVPQMISRLHEIYAFSKSKSRWGQKTPRFVRHLDLLGENFPNSKMIHLVRDPRAVVSSLIQSNIHRSNAYHGSLRWKMDVRAGLSYESEHGDRVMRVSYEDLVKNQENFIGGIAEFLKFDPFALMAGGKISQEYSAFYEKIHENLDRSLTPAFIDKWKQHLSGEELAIIEGICGELMESLGYERFLATGSPPSGFKQRARIQRAIGIARQAGRYMKFRRSYLSHLIWRKWKFGLLKDFLWTVNY